MSVDIGSSPMSPATAGITRFFKSLNKHDLPSGRREDAWPVTISHSQGSADETCARSTSSSPHVILSIDKTYDLVTFPPVIVSSDLIWTGLQLPEASFGGIAAQTRHRGCDTCSATEDATG